MLQSMREKGGNQESSYEATAVIPEKDWPGLDDRSGSGEKGLDPA